MMSDQAFTVMDGLKRFSTELLACAELMSAGSLLGRNQQKQVVVLRSSMNLGQGLGCRHGSPPDG